MFVAVGQALPFSKSLANLFMQAMNNGTRYPPHASRFSHPRLIKFTIRNAGSELLSTVGLQLNAGPILKPPAPEVNVMEISIAAFKSRASPLNLKASVIRFLQFVLATGQFGQCVSVSRSLDKREFPRYIRFFSLAAFRRRQVQVRPVIRR